MTFILGLGVGLVIYLALAFVLTALGAASLPAFLMAGFVSGFLGQYLVDP